MLFLNGPNTRIKPPPTRDGCFMSCPTPAVGLNELLGRCYQFEPLAACSGEEQVQRVYLSHV